MSTINLVPDEAEKMVEEWYDVQWRGQPYGFNFWRNQGDRFSSPEAAERSMPNRSAEYEWRIVRKRVETTPMIEKDVEESDIEQERRTR